MASDRCEPLLLRETEGALRLTLDRRQRGNAIDTATLVALIEILDRHPQPALPLVLSGGPGLFSTGADLAELAGFDAYAATAFSHLGHQAVAALERWPSVTVAVVDGYCLDAGLELALGCDLIVAVARASFGLPGAPLALAPCLGGLRRLACRLPDPRGIRLLLGGEVVSAQEAHGLGLVDLVVDEHATGIGYAQRHRDWPPGAVAAVRSLRLDRHGAIDRSAEADIFAAAFARGECQRRLRSLIDG